MYTVFYEYKNQTVAKPLTKSLARAINTANKLPMGYVKEYSGKVCHVSPQAMRRVVHLNGQPL